MMWEELWAFVIATTLLVTSPGPNGVLIARTVPTSGPMAGFATVAGFFTAFYIHGTLSILGISVILLQSATAFAVVKFLGAAYLCYIGVKSLWQAIRQGATAPAIVSPAKRKRTLAGAYAEGLLTNGLNPKVSLFYLAVFPQFMPAAADHVSAAFFLVFLHSMINLIWFTLLILFLTRMSSFAQKGHVQRGLKALTGCVFIAFGIKLASFRPAG